MMIFQWVDNGKSFPPVLSSVRTFYSPKKFCQKGKAAEKSPNFKMPHFAIGGHVILEEAQDVPPQLLAQLARRQRLWGGHVAGIQSVRVVVLQQPIDGLVGMEDLLWVRGHGVAKVTADQRLAHLHSFLAAYGGTRLQLW